MKVVHISFEDINGAGLCCYRICQAQRILGIDSSMLVLRKRQNEKFIHTFDTVKTFFVDRIVPRVPLLNNLSNEQRTIIELQKKEGKFYTIPKSWFDLSSDKLVKEADVIHIHWALGFLDYTTFFKKIERDKKVVFTLHDENLFYGIAHYKRDVLPHNELEIKYRGIKKDCIEQLNHVGIVFLSKLMYERFGIEEISKMAKTCIIHNSVDTGLYHQHERSNVRAEFSLPNTKRIIAFCACNIYEDRKGLKQLSEAAMAIDPNILILAIGRNQLPGSLSPYSNVWAYGSTSDPKELSKLLSCADVFCMPSFQEAFAQTPLEAMACGLPVVCFPCSGTEEIIRPYTGVRCRDFSVHSLIEGLKHALETKYESSKIVDFVKENFSPSIIASKYNDFYNSL